MIVIQMDGKNLKILESKAKNLAGKINRNTATALNKTARNTRDKMIDLVTSKFNISKRNANKKKVFYQSKKATPTRLEAQVRLKKSMRLGVENFGPKHTGKGVTFALTKGGGRKLIQDAFMGPRPGKRAPRLNGGVFIRKDGAKRLPIRKLYAMSPWGMFRSGKMQIPATKHAQKQLLAMIDAQMKNLSRTL